MRVVRSGSMPIARTIRSRSMSFGKFPGVAAYAVCRSHAKMLWPPVGRISSNPSEGLSEQQSAALDGLLEIRPTGGQSILAWLRQTAYAATPGNFPKLIERLRIVRAIGIEPERTTRIHQNHWLKLAREGGQTTVQHLAEL